MHVVLLLFLIVIVVLLFVLVSVQLAIISFLTVVVLRFILLLLILRIKQLLLLLLIILHLLLLIELLLLHVVKILLSMFCWIDVHGLHFCTQIRNIGKLFLNDRYLVWIFSVVLLRDMTAEFVCEYLVLNLSLIIQVASLLSKLCINQNLLFR